MSRRTRAVPALLIAMLAPLISGPLSTAAQNPSPQGQLAPPQKRKFKYDGKIEQSYDKAKDQSLVFFKLMEIKALATPKGQYEVQFSDERLSFSAYFAYPGQQLVATPHWITIAFMSETVNPEKYTDHLLSARVDGQWLSLGQLKLLRRTNYQRRGKDPLMRETMELPMPYEQFLLLANAKKIKLKLGSVEFDLENEQLEGIRDVAVHTVP